MSICDLPDEILGRIAEMLDLRSLTAFGEVNARFRHVSENIRLRFVRIEGSLESSSWGYLEKNGPRVRALDFGGCTTVNDCFREVLVACPNTTDVNLIGSHCSFERVMKDLELLDNLSTLSLPFYPTSGSGLTDAQRRVFRGLRKLFLEVRPDFLPLMFVILLLNDCFALRVCHINITTSWPRSFPSGYRPAWLLPERWETLETLICTSGDAASSEVHRKFVETVVINAPVVARPKIRRAEGCFVFKRGGVDGITFPFDSRCQIRQDWVE